MRNTRIRTKLGLILITPLLAIAALAAARILDGAQRAEGAQQVRELTRVSAAASQVSNQVHLERIEAATYLATPGADISAFNARLAATDVAVTIYRAARASLGVPPAAVVEPLARLDQHIAELEDARQQVLGENPVPASAALLRYGVLMSDVLAYQESVREVADDPQLTDEIRAVAAMSKAKTLAAEAEAFALVALADGVFTEEELTGFLGTQTGQQEAFLEFEKVATPQQQAVARSVITGGNVIFADLAIAQMMRSAGGPAGIAPMTAATSLRGIATATRWAEEQMQTMLLASATALGDSVLRRVVVESAAILLALALAITVTLVLARRLARSLRQLRRSALMVAERDLPATVAHLSDPAAIGQNTPEEMANMVAAPLNEYGRDEIGQVAHAFNAVHRAAVRVAAEQAVLRTSVAAMFVNLARRSQSLVDRMISQLDEIERDEADPRRLSQIFGLDHLATRMRRNDENLLVLAGVDSSPPRATDALVVDALRAAQSEVERYDRIEFGLVDTDIGIAAAAVNDVVRLVAEIFDNATRFSPPGSGVVCEARVLGDYMIVRIEDHGVGMPPELVQRLNEWIAQPPTVEATTFRQMGLAVVARLASRYQIQVELRSQVGYGTAAYVMLPASILVRPRARHARSEPSWQSSPPPGYGQFGAQGPRVPGALLAPAPASSGGFSFWANPYGAPNGGSAQPAYPPGADPEPAQWQGAADQGWRAAAAAAQPSNHSTTRRGLPKRVPQAQLVPGSVEEGPTVEQSAPTPRRSPEDSRGMLSTYQRGLQRGRDEGH